MSIDAKWADWLPLNLEEQTYTKKDIILAAELGEINIRDAKHICILLDEAKEMNGKFVVSESVHFDSGEIIYRHQIYDSEQEYLEKMRELI
jgi:hypothetical protein